MYSILFENHLKFQCCKSEHFFQSFHSMGPSAFSNSFPIPFHNYVFSLMCDWGGAYGFDVVINSTQNMYSPYTFTSDWEENCSSLHTTSKLLRGWKYMYNCTLYIEGWLDCVIQRRSVCPGSELGCVVNS